MKILELTNFSAGADGVFARVKEESTRLAKNGNQVIIFSSNFVKGKENETAEAEDSTNGIKIKRFPAKKLGGESFMSWDFRPEALKFKPNVIIAHAYRHQHTLLAQKIAKEIGAKVFLVTHAPFARSSSRSLAGKIAVSLYDSFIAQSKLKKFDKIIAITKWEIPYLLKLGVSKEKISYIPNGIPEKFFKTPKKAREQAKIIFLGRIAPIKNLEVVIKAFPLIKDKSIIFEIYGPSEENYLKKLKLLIKSLGLENRIIITNKKYDSEEQIKKLDSSFIYVLPSISEGMPQTLIEALARQKVCLASDNLGNKDLIQNSKNGFLFQTNSPESCASQINHILSLNKSRISKIKEEALDSVKQFSWNRIISKIEDLINNQ